MDFLAALVRHPAGGGPGRYDGGARDSDTSRRKRSRVDWDRSTESEAASPTAGHRGGGSRQGLPQRCDAGDVEERGGTDVHSFRRRNRRANGIWDGKTEKQQAVYTNRRRLNRAYGKSLLRKRGELIERSFAHCYDTGGMRRTYLRGHENISQTTFDSRRGVQSELDLPHAVGIWYPTRTEKSTVPFVFVLLWLLDRYLAPARRLNYSVSSS